MHLAPCCFVFCCFFVTYSYYYFCHRWYLANKFSLCNEQISSNVSVKFHLKRFLISRCTMEIANVIKNVYEQFVIYVVGCTQATPERHNHSNSYQWTDQQKMCWIGPPFCFTTAAKRLFHCNIAFLTVWSSTSCHLFLITFWRSLRFVNGSRLPS